ncbi:MAG: hypothetical protein EOO07_31880 [Chitinophagaceae bacterium]|nr:MAG: hypothetical protein EOO07_31880 [Chitinophagaceae bacterium]
MEEHATVLDSLVNKAETYAKTNIDLLKLKATDKVSDTVSSVVLKLVYVFLSLLIVLMLNYGVALWISDEMGIIYSGFFIVAGFYIIVLALVFAFRKKIVTGL